MLNLFSFKLTPVTRKTIFTIGFFMVCISFGMQAQDKKEGVESGVHTTALVAGQSLNEKEKLYSADLSHYLILQDDGNLCTYTAGNSRYVWCSMTRFGRISVRQKGQLTMQDDGKLRVFDGYKDVVWDPYKTKKYKLGSGNKLIVTKYGQLNIIDSSGDVIWDSQKTSKRDGEFIDPRNDKKYQTVELNGLTWFAENLNYDVGAGCRFFDDDPENREKYGRLYTWEAANNACPKDWRLPSDEEWKALANAYGGYYDEMDGKEVVGNAKESNENLLEKGSSGFNALFGGMHDDSHGGLYDLEKIGFYWSATSQSDNSDNALFYSFHNSVKKMYRSNTLKSSGLSCRCVQDLSTTDASTDAVAILPSPNPTKPADKTTTYSKNEAVYAKDSNDNMRKGTIAEVKENNNYEVNFTDGASPRKEAWVSGYSILTPAKYTALLNENHPEIGDAVYACNNREGRVDKRYVYYGTFQYHLTYTDGKSPAYEKYVSPRHFLLKPDFSSPFARKFLTVMAVTTHDYLEPSQTNLAFSGAIPQKVSDDYQLVDVHCAVKAKTIYVLKSPAAIPSDGCIDYAKYVAKEISWKPYPNDEKKEYAARLEAYKEAFDFIYKNFPADHFAIKYTGHGSGTTMFEGTLDQFNVTYDLPNGRKFLSHATQKMGKKFAFLDWGTNCNSASWNNINAQQPYTDYILASEFLRATPPIDKAVERRPDDNYAKYWDKEVSIEASLKRMMDDYDEVWSMPECKAYWKKSQKIQSLNLYKTSGFAAVKDKLQPVIKAPKNYQQYSYRELERTIVPDVSLYAYLKGEETSTADKLWNAFQIKRITNQDAVDWSQLPRPLDKANGMYITATY